jgi:plastocyanin
MNPRRLAAVAGTAFAMLLVAAPASSQAPTLASIQASDNAFNTDGGGPPNVTIAAGGHVNFAYFMGNSRHNVVFTGAAPTVCGSSGGPPATASALPGAPTGPGWDGGCDFQTPGTYPFVCALHSSMTGSVTVVAAGAAPPPPPPPPPPTAGLGPAASGLKVTAQQGGTSVRGTVKVARSGSRLLARAFAKRSALSGGRSKTQVQVGRQLRSKVSATTVTFAAPLNSAARRALRRDGRLAITLRLSVTPAQGEAYTATRTVILRPS